MDQRFRCLSSAIQPFHNQAYLFAISQGQALDSSISSVLQRYKHSNFGINAHTKRFYLAPIMNWTPASRKLAFSYIFNIQLFASILEKPVPLSKLTEIQLLSCHRCTAVTYEKRVSISHQHQMRKQMEMSDHQFKYTRRSSPSNISIL